MPTPTITVEFGAPDGTLFVDYTADVISNPVPRWSVGSWGKTPNDRVAKKGKLTLYLDNSASNSQGTLGYYRFNNTIRTFDYGFRIRITITSGAKTKMYLFYATDLDPIAGKYGRRLSKLKANDYIGKLSEAKLNAIDIQLSKRSDQVIDTIVDNITGTPKNTDYHTGLDVFPTSLHRVKDGSTSALGAAKQLAGSDLSFLFNRTDTTDGETLTWYTRADWGGSVGSVATFSETMAGLTLKSGSLQHLNRFIMSSIQTRVDSAATTVLWALGDNEIEIPGNTTLEQMTASYRDPTSEATNISGTAIVDPLVANTHFRMSSIAGDGGNDLNANLTTTLSVGGNATKILLQNTGSATGYINLLKIIGKAVYWYSPITIEPLNVSFRTLSGSKDFHYQSSYWSSYASLSLMGDRLKDQYGNALLSVPMMNFWPNKDATLMDAYLDTEQGDYITVNETIKDVGAAVGDDYIVTGETVTVLPGKILNVTWSLMDGANTYLLVDESGNNIVTSTGNGIYLGG